MRHNQRPTTIFVIITAAILMLLPLFTTAWAQEANRDPSTTVHKMQPLSKPYRVIFNCDGWAVFDDAKGDIDQWIANLFDPLDGSHVDAVFWCDGSGGNTARYKSEVLELAGELVGDIDPHLKKVLDADQDPPEIIVREAHKRELDVFYSFRINDTHDVQPSCFREFASFKKEHPEWQIGEGHPYGQPTSLNFAVPEVRELKFRTIKEIFQKYDFDGLEIDFMRSPPYFIPGEELQHSHFLTKLLTRIREHLNQRGKERGRPIHLAVRVDENLDGCRLDGFDLATWIERGLIDMVVMGSGVIDIEVEEFKALAKEQGVLVYPCLYGWPSRYHPIPEALAKGLAMNYWHQGADGIYLFNWFPHDGSQAGGPHLISLMKQVGDPKALRADKKKLMFAADRGKPSKHYPHNWTHCALPATLSIDKNLNVGIRVGVDFQNIPIISSLTLRAVVQDIQKSDVLEVMLNGTPVPGMQLAEGNVLTAPVKADQLIQGQNTVNLKLREASSNTDTPRIVKALELDVVFPD